MNELSKHCRDFSILLLTETWLRDDEHISLKGFDLIRRDRQKKNGGGVAILIKSGIKYQVINGMYDCNGALETCGVEIHTDSGIFSVGVVYRSPDSTRISAANWKHFFSQFGNRAFLAGILTLIVVVGSAIKSVKWERILARQSVKSISYH